MTTTYRWPKTHAAVVAAEAADAELDRAMDDGACNDEQLLSLMAACEATWEAAAEAFLAEGPAGNPLLKPNAAFAHKTWLRQFAYTETES